MTSTVDTATLLNLIIQNNPAAVAQRLQANNLVAAGFYPSEENINGWLTLWMPTQTDQNVAIGTLRKVLDVPINTNGLNAQELLTLQASNGGKSPGNILADQLLANLPTTTTQSMLDRPIQPWQKWLVLILAVLGAILVARYFFREARKIFA